MTNPLDLEALDKAAKAATSGEWRVSKNDRFWVDRDGDESGRGWRHNRDNDAAFIVAAQPRNIRAILSRLQAAESEVELWKARWEATNTVAEEYEAAHEKLHDHVTAAEIEVERLKGRNLRDLNRLSDQADDATLRATIAEALVGELVEETEALREFYHADKAVRDVGRMNSTPEQDARLDRARSALSKARPDTGEQSQ